MEPEETETPALKNDHIVKGIQKLLLQFVLPIIAAGILLYLFLAPVVTTVLYPAYSVRDKYVDIKSCSDTTIKQDTSFFLPQTCQSLTNGSSIGCVYVAPDYIAPTTGTSDQQTLCPALTPNEIIKGNPNSAQPVFKIDKALYQIVVASGLTILISAIYITFRVVIYKRK